MKFPDLQLPARLQAIDSLPEAIRDWFNRHFPVSSARFVVFIHTLDCGANIAWEARVSVVVSVLLYLTATIPDQSIDAFRALAENSFSHLTSHPEYWYSPLLFLGAQFVLAFALWFWGRVSLELTAQPIERRPKLEVRILRWLPRLCGMVPFIASSVGFIKAGQRGGDRAMLLLVLVVVVWAMFVGLIVIRARYFPGDFTTRFKGNPGKGKTGWIITTMTYAAVAGGIALGIIVTLRPTSGNVGTLTVIYFVMFLWTVVGSGLTWLGRLVKFPFMSLIVAWAVVLGLWDWTDNHQLATVRTTAPNPLPTLGRATPAWLQAKIRETPGRKSKPVILVAAEGGGIYAAYHAAYALGALADEIPGFKNHVFAISGVSGGSVGASAFAQFCAWADDDRPRRAGYFREASRQVFSADFLQPVVSMALFPDLWQRFIPWGINAFDRAHGLEFCYDRVLKECHPQRQPPTPFYDLTREFAARGVPALFLNTTCVETGERVVIANLSTSAPDDTQQHDGPLGFATYHGTSVWENLPQSVAAFASARFPYVTPVASAMLRFTPDAPARKYRLADGGYFENSGLATLLDLLPVFDELSYAPDAPNMHVIVIRIGTTHRPAEPADWFTESLSPVRALFNTRDARAVNVRDQIIRAIDELNRRNKRELNAGTAGGSQLTAEFVEILLDVQSTQIPLGWVLSASSRKEIETQVDNNKAALAKVRTLLARDPASQLPLLPESSGQKLRSQSVQKALAK